jgi:hypothetical protein
MNKSKLRLSILAIALMGINATAWADNRAVQISIGGIGPGVDAAAFETVKQVIGNTVANGVIDKFNVLGYGIEGGFSACAEANSRSRGFPAFVKQLRTISPNKNTTAYSLNVVATCTADN